MSGSSSPALLRPLVLLGRHAPPVLAGSVFLGLAWPALADWFKPAVVPTVYVLLALSLLRLDWVGVTRNMRRPGPAILALLWLLLASPLIVAATLSLLPVPTALAIAIVLTSAAPPIISSVAFALIFGLDASLAVVALVSALVIVPLTLPVIALRLLGLHIEIGLVDFILRLATLVGSSLAVVAAARRLLGPERITRHATAIDGMAVLTLIVFAIGIMAGVTDRFLADPRQVTLWVVAAFLANLGMQLLAGAGFVWLGRQRALTVALMSGNRNCALLIAVLASKVGFDTLMYLALAQLPIYILPAALAPLYRKLLRTPGR